MTRESKIRYKTVSMTKLSGPEIACPKAGASDFVTSAEKKYLPPGKRPCPEFVCALFVRKKRTGKTKALRFITEEGVKTASYASSFVRLLLVL